MERGARARGIRLFQDSFNMQSLSLYSSLGFEAKEPAVLIKRETEERSAGRDRGPSPRGRRSRAVREPLPHGPRLRANERVARRTSDTRLLAVRRPP